MKKILLFDVDGTIAESTQKISTDMKNQLVAFREKGYEVGIVGGGRYDKILDQLDNLELDHVFAECGCIYYKKNKLVYEKNIRSHVLYPKINVIIKKALEYLSNVDYEITGHFVDLRTGLIYISLIGMDATLTERAKFIKLDKTHRYRSNLLNKLHREMVKLGIDKDLSILEGGSVGIVICPTECDKTQVLESLSSLEYDKIYYFGDKYEPNGNDHRLLYHSRVTGYPVNNPTECLDILNGIFNRIMYK
jgi:HAD superfamily hydrolase (TIGR01484 family)